MVNHAAYLSPIMISINRLRKRKSDFAAGDWIMDSGAFSEISTYGDYRYGVAEYAEQIKRWKRCGNLLTAVSQDYMCEPFILQKTGLAVIEHQTKTIRRYDALIAQNTGVYIMPVLQGFEPNDYAEHIESYGNRLGENAWVGVGSVCKRNANPRAIERVLLAIKTQRPDLKLHGFGIKKTALSSGLVQELLYSADSMAWSFAARRGDGNANCWRTAARYAKAVEALPIQRVLFCG